MQTCSRILKHMVEVLVIIYAHLTAQKVTSPPSASLKEVARGEINPLKYWESIFVVLNQYNEYSTAVVQIRQISFL